MGELDEPILSVDARRLVFDLANGCTANRRSGGAPCIVVPPPRGQMPQTRGQVGDFAVSELLKSDLVNLFGAAPPQPFKLTAKGKAYYERHQIISS